MLIGCLASAVQPYSCGAQYPSFQRKSSMDVGPSTGGIKRRAMYALYEVLMSRYGVPVATALRST